MTPLTQTNTYDDSVHRARIKHELERVGVSRLGLLRMGSRYLPQIINHDEHLGGVVYGRSSNGAGMLIATDRRVIFLERKPFYINEDELSYYVVSGISYSHAGPGTAITLHTRIKDYTLHSLNQRCAKTFVNFIESRCLEHTERENYDNNIENGLL